MRRLPVKLFPAAKDYLWGGNRLNDDFAFDMEYFFKGDCFFIPANSESLKIHGKAEFLDISC